MAKRKRKAVPTHRPILTEHDITWLFAVAIRHSLVFEEAARLIKQEYFNETELWLALVWRVVVEYYRAFGHLPTRRVIISRCNAEMEYDPDVVAAGDEPKLKKFITTAFNLEDEDMHPNVVLTTLQRFLEDRHMSLFHETVSMPQTPLDLAGELAKWAEEAATFNSLSTGRVALPFLEGWDERTQIGVTTPTNITFLDSFLGGGVAAGESYGIMGPYGGGKSTLAMMITTEIARSEHNRWSVGGREGVPGRAYHFIYEDSMDDLRLLSLSYLARIPKKRMAELIQLRDPNAYSRVGNYQPYERQRFRTLLSRGETPDAEWDRYNEAIEILNRCWRLVDMTGADSKHIGRGHGLVDEISGIVARDLAMNPGLTCSGVLADYAGAAVRAHFGATNRDQSEMRLVLQSWPSDMKRNVAIRFNCPAWSIQQLNTESNACRPGHLPKMTDSAECKSFAENCHFCFVIGLPTRGGQMPFVARKHRREGEHAPIVLTLRGGHAKIVDTREDWVYNERTKSITSREELDRYYNSITGPRPAAGRPVDVDEDDEHAPTADDNDTRCNVAPPRPSRRPQRTDWYGDRFSLWRRGGGL